MLDFINFFSFYQAIRFFESHQIDDIDGRNDKENFHQEII